jgi:hypothetical protein
LFFKNYLFFNYKIVKAFGKMAQSFDVSRQRFHILFPDAFDKNEIGKVPRPAQNGQPLGRVFDDHFGTLEIKNNKQTNSMSFEKGFFIKKEI